MARETTQIFGTVEGVNEKGLKVQGTWYNFSKHHAVPAVPKGQLVTLTVEGGKWINSLTFGSASPAPTPTPQAPPAPPTHSPTPAPASRPKSELFSPDSDEPDQRTAVRIAAVNTAFQFQGSGYSKYEDPFELAEQIAGWINRA